VKAVILLPQSLTTMMQLTKPETKDRKHTMKWECSCECKPLTETKIDSIVSLRAAFENPMQEVQHALDTSDDGRPNQHYTKVVADSERLHQRKAVTRVKLSEKCGNGSEVWSRLKSYNYSRTEHNCW